MLRIRKTGEGYYLVSLATPLESLGKRECVSMAREIGEVMKPHREISIDLKGVKAIGGSGCNLLQELKSKAGRISCRLRFINVEPELKAKLNGTQEK